MLTVESIRREKIMLENKLLAVTIILIATQMDQDHHRKMERSHNMAHAEMHQRI